MVGLVPRFVKASRCGGVAWQSTTRSTPFAPNSTVQRTGFLTYQQTYHDSISLFISCSTGNGSSSLPSNGNRNGHAEERPFDVVALGNLCVDIVKEVDVLPSSDKQERRELLHKLTASPPPTDAWEAGGNANFMIAAARLGMNVACVGHLGEDVYGNFLRSILQEEKVMTIEPIVSDLTNEELNQTLLCFVLLGPQSGHAFCSKYDFGPWPLLGDVQWLPISVQKVIQNSKALFTNGCVFDELPASLVMQAVQKAHENGSCVFFDPGPRSRSFTKGDRKHIMDALLDETDVLLMTQDEGEILSGVSDPEEMARFFLSRPGACTSWVVVKLGAEGAILVDRERSYYVDALEVPVRDTVGCGDSFASAIVLGYTHGHNILQTLSLANAVGAATAMGQGAGRNVASVDSVASLLMSTDDEYSDAALDHLCSKGVIDREDFDQQRQDAVSV